MSSIIIPEQWRQQPPASAQIDWSNEITQGLVDVIDCSGRIPRSLILGTPATSFGTKTAAGVSTQGRVMDSTAAFGGWYFQRSDGKYAPANQTHIAVAQYNSTSGTYAGLFASADGTGANGSLSLQQGNSASELFSYYNGNTRVDLTNGLAPILTGKPVVVALTAGNGAWNGYANGVNVPGGKNVGISAVSSYSTSRLVLFGERAASAGYATKGKQALHLFFNRVLTPAEVASISANPWQIFKKQSIIDIILTANTNSLTGSATAVASVSAMLSGPERLSSATTASATSAGALTVYTPVVDNLVGTAGDTYQRPNSDVVVGTWTPSTGTALWPCVSKATNDDTTYITDSSATAPTDMYVTLSAASDPAISTGHRILIRAWATGATVPTLYVTLYQVGKGNAEVRSVPINAQVPTDFYVDLTPAEADFISDYGVLDIHLLKANNSAVCNISRIELIRQQGAIASTSGDLTVTASGIAALTGAASGIATASSGLSHSVPIASVSAAVSAATAAMSHGIPLSSFVSGVATSTGAAIKTATLSGAATAAALSSAVASKIANLLSAATGAATATGAASKAMTLAAASAATASSVAVIAHGVPLIATVGGIATGAATVAQATPLAAAASAVASITANLFTSQGASLYAAALAVAITAGSLSKAVSVSGNVAGSATTSGGLKHVLQLVSSTVGSASSSAIISKVAQLASSAATVASATGVMSKLTQLAGSVSAAATATGSVLKRAVLVAISAAQSFTLGDLFSQGGAALVGLASTTATGAANLSKSILATGQASSQALARGAASVVSQIASAVLGSVLIIKKEIRSMVLVGESRIMRVLK